MQKAFTLIELLIVVAIIAILAAIAVPNFLEAQVRSKVSRVHSDLRSIATAIESYITDYGKPAPGQEDIGRLLGISGQYKLCLDIATSQLTTPIAYISSYPSDPFNKNSPLGDVPDGRTTYLYFAFTSDEIPGAGQDIELRCYAMGYTWATQSKGPAKSNSIYGGLHSHLADRTGFVYDPSNGTRSEGTIIRTNKGVSDANGN
ncbi:MAG TPA: prepilin-type N-terminal cleavage/methylation domain-containing protein [Sumerlaeia bacterium]|nr:prepilin-type N-terminal cleavage/methylation domain-containing protein [Sumerlaeia bacterium]